MLEKYPLVGCLSHRVLLGGGPLGGGICTKNPKHKITANHDTTPKPLASLSSSLNLVCMVYLCGDRMLLAWDHLQKYLRSRSTIIILDEYKRRSRVVGITRLAIMLLDLLDDSSYLIALASWSNGLQSRQLRSSLCPSCIHD